ncbi:MAG: C-terminal binding protein [Pseudonocardiaceae bacterium]
MTAPRAKFGILDRLEHADEEESILADVGDVYCYRARSNTDLPDDISELDAVMVWHELAVTKEILTRLTRCRVVVRAGVGYDSVDLAAASMLGIPVVNVPDYGTNDVADHTVMLLLSATRRLLRYEAALREDPARNWAAEVGGRGMRRLTGRRVGIVGFGRIGTAVAHRLRAFGCDLAFFDPYLPSGVDKSWQVRRNVSLEELLDGCDIVSLHVPHTAETDRMINATVLGDARDGLVLVNTSRGSVVDLDAVYGSLRQGRLEAFASDVLPVEPPSLDHPLIAAYVAQEAWQVGRVVLTPHAAFYSEDCERELRRKSALAMRDAVEGRPLTNCVNHRDLWAPRAAVAPMMVVPS